MPSQKDKEETVLSAGVALQFREFFETWPPEETEKALWNLLIAAMASNDSSGWEPVERAGQMSLYKRLTTLLPALRDDIYKR